MLQSWSRALFAAFGGRKATLAILFAVLTALNDALGWGITPEALDKIGIGALAFIGVEGTRDVIATARTRPAEHSIVDDPDDGYDEHMIEDPPMPRPGSVVGS